MANLMKIFEEKLKEKSNWRKLEAYAASYLRDRWAEGPKTITYPKFDDFQMPADLHLVHQSEWCIARLYLTLPREDFPSFHTLYEKWLQQGDNHSAKQWVVEVQMQRLGEDLDEEFRR